jgi:CRISPR-associated RAMP protein (TIGR02581 family)
MFDKLQSRLETSGWLTAQTALRIGAGRSTAVVGTDLPVVRDAEGKPYIPGSSFKGVLRSRLEGFVRAACDDRRVVCIPTENAEWCITEAEMGTKKEGLAELVRQGKLKANEYDVRLTEWIKQKSCLLCLTWGSPWLASKVLVRDLLVDEALWFGQFQIRDGVAIDRDTETASEGKLYDYEVVPSGTRFHFKLILENGRPWQWGMIFCGLKAFETGNVPIGGSKSRGLGWVKLQLDERRLFSLDIKESSARLEKLFGFLDGAGFEEIGDEMVKMWTSAFKQKIAEAASQ